MKARVVRELPDGLEPDRLMRDVRAFNRQVDRRRDVAQVERPLSCPKLGDRVVEPAKRLADARQ